MSHGTKPTILLIEADSSLRRLIALGLQYRGIHVIEASSPSNLPSIEAQELSLLILDVDGRGSSDWSLLTAIQTQPCLSALPIVTLAWECLIPTVLADEQPNNILQTHITCLTKPFDARILHTTVEQLLLARANTLQEASQAILLSTQATTPAPSIWPLITAAGLFITFIGLMGLFAVTVLGLCIVVVALLWWTLGTSPKNRPAPFVGM